MRLIDGTKLQKDIRRDLEMSVMTDDFYKGANYVLSKVYKAKRVEAEPIRHGHWDADADGYADGELVYDHWYCSECGWDDNGFLEEKPNYKYCPNCGAKMEDNE